MKRRRIPLFSSFFEIVKMLAESSPDFPETFENYDKYHVSESAGGVLSLERAKLVAKWIEAGSKVLDVGIGDGTVAKYLAEAKGCEVVGMDVSEAAAKRVEEELGLKVIVRDVNRGLKLGDGEIYDFIVLMEVIEHLVSPQVLLSEAVRHARKGVVVTMPNSGFVKWRLQMLRGYFPRQSFTHLHFWTIKDFELFCRKLGLEILGFKTLLPKSSVEAWFVKRLRNLLAYQQCWLLKPKLASIDLR